MRHIVILGSTGSIGGNCLKVLRQFPQRFSVCGLAAGRNIKRLAEQVAAFKPRKVAVLEERSALELRERLDPAWKVDVVWGEAGYVEVATLEEAETVVSAMVGAAGLVPTWSAIQKGKLIALANKETLVMAGQLVMAEAVKRGVRILPVDSEHSAIFQALAGQRPEDIHRLILTASGGPFRDRERKELVDVSPAEALAHPNWNMGAKISIDSATLMNKGLEAIEARWIFGVPWEKIAIHIHPQSIVHSMVEFVDGSILAQLGVPDMRVPIAYALSYPERLPLALPHLDLPQAEPLTFSEPDLERFPCLALALEVGRRGGTGPAALNAANEVAVRSFLNGALPFLGIAEVVAQVIDQDGAKPIDRLDRVLAADREARIRAAEMIAGYKKGSYSC